MREQGEGWKEEGVEQGRGKEEEDGHYSHTFFDDSDKDRETPAKRRECSWSAALYNSVR